MRPPPNRPAGPGAGERRGKDFFSTSRPNEFADDAVEGELEEEDDWDAIQDELLQMGVTVFDRQMKWFVGKGARAQGGRGRPSLRDGSSNWNPLRTLTAFFCKGRSKEQN